MEGKVATDEYSNRPIKHLGDMWDWILIYFLLKFDFFKNYFFNIFKLFWYTDFKNKYKNNIILIYF